MTRPGSKQAHLSGLGLYNSGVHHLGDTGVLGLGELFRFPVFGLLEPRLLKPGERPAHVSVEIALLLRERLVAQDTVIARLPETYQWLLVPEQKDPQSAVSWQVIRLTGQDPLAQRASAKLRKEELLLSSYAASLLRMEMDRVPLWRDGVHVSIRQLVEDFARYLYLPRLRSPEVLVKAIEAGLGLLTWRQDSFAYAESYDETAGRYRGMRSGFQIHLDADNPGLLVKPEIAWPQMEQESAVKPSDVTSHIDGPISSGSDETTNGAARPAEVARPRRYHGTVTLDPERVGRDAGKIADEIITHLVGLLGSTVRVTLEIDAEVPAGVPENVVRIVTENGRELKFSSSSGFESK